MNLRTISAAKFIAIAEAHGRRVVMQTTYFRNNHGFDQVTFPTLDKTSDWLEQARQELLRTFLRR